MSALIGRHGGGHGGGHHGGGRRFFGGGGWGGWDWGWGGWGWPWPWYGYGYPLAMPYAVPVAVPVAGEDPGEVVGAAALALAPGADGLSCEMRLDPDLQLCVAIAVDGRRYETSVDLSGLLRGIAERAAQARASRGGPASPGDPEVRDATAQASRAVSSAGTILVGALCDRHARTVTAGFWDALKGAYRTASSPVTWFNKKVAQTIQHVPGLKQAVTTAATAVATAYGGPAAGALAGRLAGPIIDSSAETGGDPTRLFDRAKQSAHQQSGGDPRAVQAVAHAQKAITQTAAAYTLHTISRGAASGDPEAARQIAQIRQAAQAGDPAAARAMQILAEVERVQDASSQAGPPPAAPPPAFAGASMRVTPPLDELQGLALSSAARTRLTHGFGEAVIFVFSPRHGVFSVPFDSRTEAVRYAHRVDPRAISYVAVVDVSDPESPFLLSERSFGGPGFVAASQATPATTTTSGFVLPFALGAGAAALWNLWDREQFLLDAALNGQGVAWKGRRILVPDPSLASRPAS